MGNKYGSFSSWLLTSIGDATGFFEWPLEYSESWRRKQLRHASKQSYSTAILRLKGRGLIKVVKKGDRKFLVLTSHGELEKLILKSRLDKPAFWDGKWRIIIFDIPEDFRDKRDLLRGLLKNNGFIKLQASVFINPYPLNREAVAYLQQAKLMPYIRIIRVDEMDNDLDLKKKFHL